jgi:DNA-binding MarR family transcriptional regulator
MVDQPRPRAVNYQAKPARDALSWDDLAPISEGLAYAPMAIRASASELTERLGLGPRGAFILNLISNGIIYPADLARALKTRRSLITADLTRLKDAGLISASNGEDDKRRSRLLLTAAGEAAVGSIRDSIAAILRRNLAEYSRDELRLFSQMLRDARGNAGAALPYQSPSVD